MVMREVARSWQNVNYSVDTFIDSLTFAHKQLGLSYSYLGRLFGVSKETVRKWVKGKARPNRQRMRQISVMLNDLIEANSYSLNLSYFSPYHMGPPDNQFSFKEHDPPLVKKALAMLVHYADMLDLKNKVILDTAGLYIRKYLKEKKVNRIQVGMLSLACLKVAMLKHRHTWDVKHLIEDRNLYYRFFAELALKYLAD